MKKGTQVAEGTSPSVEVTTKKLGRPVNPDSKRQKELATKADRGINGYIPLGRPVNKNSKRQIELALKAEKKANGTGGQKGRPKMTEQEKADAKAKREAAKAAAGIV